MLRRSTRGRVLRPALVLVMLVASACAGPFAAGSCTEIGCDSAVVFDLSYDVVAGGTYDVEACAAELCRSDTIRVPAGDDVVSVRGDGLELLPRHDQVRLVLPGGDDGHTRTVSLTITDGSDARIVETTAEADFEEQRPNGPNCPPVCWVARVAT